MQDPQPDFQPLPGAPETLAPGLRRIVAPNASPMTYRGTNTYLVGSRGLAVIDPGPMLEAHLDAILAAVTPGQSGVVFEGDRVLGGGRIASAALNATQEVGQSQ